MTTNKFSWNLYYNLVWKHNDIVLSFFKNNPIDNIDITLFKTNIWIKTICYFFAEDQYILSYILNRYIDLNENTIIDIITYITHHLSFIKHFIDGWHFINHLIFKKKYYTATKLLITNPKYKSYITHVAYKNFISNDNAFFNPQDINFVVFTDELLYLSMQIINDTFAKIKHDNGNIPIKLPSINIVSSKDIIHKICDGKELDTFNFWTSDKNLKIVNMILTD